MQVLDAQLQREILKRLMFADSLKYSELHKEIENHDLFNYHLRYLVNKGLIQKLGSKYQLTADGRKYVGYMEEDGEIQKQFKVGMFIDLIRKYKGKYQMLLHRRLKHPHYGLIGAVSGKLKWGENLESNLTRELKEELQIEVLNYTIGGVVHEFFENEDKEKVADAIFFVIFVDGWKGMPSKKSVEGEYFWCDIDRILELDNIFREGFEKGLPHLKRYLEDKESYTPYIMENTTGGLKY